MKSRIFVFLPSLQALVVYVSFLVLCTGCVDGQSAVPRHETPGEGVRTAVVATIRRPHKDMWSDFLCYHLHLGFDHVFVFFDDAEDHVWTGGCLPVCMNGRVCAVLHACVCENSHTCKYIKTYMHTPALSLPWHPHPNVCIVIITQTQGVSQCVHTHTHTHERKHAGNHGCNSIVSERPSDVVGAGA